MYPYALIGNCQASALISDRASLDWLCFPRPDSPPTFGRLLDSEGGHFSIETIAKSRIVQQYEAHTVVLVSTVTTEDGDQFQITDFCPRFLQHGRIYRPPSLFRIVRPLSGTPLIHVNCRPVDGWSKEPLLPTRGNSHLRFAVQGEEMRLTTNMPLTYLNSETSFQLTAPLYFALTLGAGIEEDLVSVSERFLDQTVDYWTRWVKHCSLPACYQRETIRSALTLKLHCYEDTGAILAALTTSLPEELGKTRNWDYRFCWLRDTYFVLSAFHSLGHFEEMEGFIKFLLNIAGAQSGPLSGLRPVYRLDRSLPLPELQHLNWAGYGGSQPVRSDNQAAEHVQNDVYGEMILTLAPVYFDERFRHLRTADLDRLIVQLGKCCAESISQPDAGLWELRDGWREHSFSNLMCWAGLERLQRIRARGFLPHVDFDVGQALRRAEQSIHNATKDNALRNGPSDDSFDSALLQVSTLRFPDDELNRETVRRIHEELRLDASSPRSSFLYRYLRPDDFGRPQSAFLICSFWLVQALAKTGQMLAAEQVMDDLMAAANGLGLFSEHYLPTEQKQSGNFPQAYSHVGQINAAFAVSPRWSEVL
ncbi:MAG: glycoside hydrolase family 15 protein [Bdellovibrionales bacterium]|nr:glycoside hydrolase family 15 protein [Bdellovibrionales bacterium]